MPDIKHHFRLGKMNKDLDERLVPNGEYRDALNIEISTSEGSNVGSVQNIKGTTQILGKVYDSNKKVITDNWNTDSFGLTNAICVGTKLNNEHDRIYWFIKADEADCIAEYDDASGVISPVLVDTNNILDFKASTYITGINVLDGMLMWTDGEKEPKKIDISVFKSGCSSDFTTHTKYTGQIIASSDLASSSSFTEEHITVAKQAPMGKPTLVMSSSTRGGIGTGTSTVVISNAVNTTFTDTEGVAKDAGTVLNLTFSPLPNWQAGDIITCTSIYEELGQQENLEIKLLINSISASNVFNCTIQSIPVEIPYVPLTWEAILSEEGVLFEKKFVSFAYRWKYYSGEYSTFSPFSELAFLPDTFEYLSTNGYNDGMINNLRQLSINITESRPIDVEEVDILYKETNNSNVYVVDTLKYASDGTFPTEYKLESEIISKVVESNQTLRPWDNVPRKATAQEVTANRLIYANYLQNYDIPDFNLPNISMSISQAAITTVKEPQLSIKSLRTYQVGVVYLDKYNRQSPVFTSANASKQTSKDYAKTVNSINVSLSNQPPDWATHFKYYIKETSNEYYNLAMDRYYLAEDGNVWLSFPSSERNKVDEETYLILKKKHDSDDFVATKSRYKILDISNDAPDFLKLKERAIATGDVEARTSGIPQIGSVSFEFRGPNPQTNPSFGEGFSSDAVIQIANGGVKSDKYKVVSGGPTGDTDDTGSNDQKEHIYKVTLEEPIKAGDTMVSSISAGDSFEIVLFEEKFERKAEFYGRFFVKINRDSNFDTNIIASFPEEDEQFGIIESRTIFGNAQNTGAGSDKQEASWFDTADRRRSRWVTQENNGHPKLGQKKMTFYFCGSPKSRSTSFDKSNTINNFLKLIELQGTLFRFKGSQSDALSPIYEITKNAQEDRRYRYRRTSGKRHQSAKRRQYNLEFKKKDSTDGYTDPFRYPTSGNPTNYISEIQIMQNVVSADVEVLTSSNPAIWETEPKESAELDIYYETGLSRPISQHGSAHVLDFKNCYSFGNGVESDRINDDYNAPRIGKGVKVSAVLDEPYKEERRKNGLIYSGIFNSTSGINRLNQFIQGEAITKDLNPHYGGIQKLHARNTDLIVLCEDKCLKVLANKDAIFEANGNPQLTATNKVLGQAVPFIGEYGISKNPESFASYAYRCYFTDKSRGAVIRLSRDGLTAISDAGMEDFFKDTLPGSTLILGSYDGSKGLYNLTLDGQTVSFDEKVKGFPSFKSFVPEGALSLNNKYYSFKTGELFVHENDIRNNFYGVQYESSVTLLINEMPETIKGFKTLNYGGSLSRVYTNDYDNATSTNTKGWYCDHIHTDTQQGFIKEFKKKEGRFYNHIKGEATTLENLDSKEFNVQGIGQLTAISGDLALSDKTVTVNLTGIANTTNPGATFDVEVGTEIHSTNSSVTILITPDTGSTLTASDLSVSSTGANVDSVSFAQSGLNVIATVNFTDGVNMPSSNLAINLAVTGDGVLNKYKLENLAIIDQSDGNITQTVSYASSGSNETANPSGNQLGYQANYTTQNTVATVTIDLATGYNFNEQPSFKITVEDNDPESYYVITHQDKDVSDNNITIGVGGKVLADVDKRVYTVAYKFPAQDTNKNEIIFHSKSVLENAADVNKISGYDLVGGDTVGRFAQTKELKIFGAIGADFRVKNFTTSTASTSGSSTTLTLTAVNNDIKVGMLVTGTGISGTVTVAGVNGTSITLSTAQTISSTAITFSEWWNGTTFVGSETDLEIPSTGFSLVSIPFFETTVSKRYYILIEAISPTTLLPITPSSTGDPVLQGNVYSSSNVVQNPFYINQLANVDLTLGMAATADFTVTSSDITKTYIANLHTDEDSDVASFSLSLTATATGNITKLRDPEIEDWSNYLSTNSDDIDLFSNGFELDYQTPIIAINNTVSPKTISITSDMRVNKYGSDDLTSNLAINNFASVTGGSGGGGSRLYTPTVTGSGGGLILGQHRATYNDGNGNSGTAAKNVLIGTASGTNLTSGTGVMYGNFYNNGYNDISLSISATQASAFHQVSGLTITKTSLVGVAPSQDLHYSWTAQLDEQIDSASDMTFNIAVSLAQEP